MLLPLIYHGWSLGNTLVVGVQELGAQIAQIVVNGSLRSAFHHLFELLTGIEG